MANADVRSLWMVSATPSTSTTGPNQPHSDAKLGPGKAEMEQVGEASIDASSHGSSRRTEGGLDLFKAALSVGHSMPTSGDLPTRWTS